jgi:hypothetical protein
MTWTIYNNDKAWGFLSRAEQRAIYDHNGVLIEYDYAYGVWRVIDHHAIPRDKKLYRAAPEPTPAVDADQTAQLDTANARIAELEAANDDLRERYKAFACWAERKLSGIKTEETP